MANWREYLELNQQRFVEELKAFLRIPSISALPENMPEITARGRVAPGAHACGGN